MNINQIIKKGSWATQLSELKAIRNKELGVIRGPLPRWARKQSLSGLARKLGFAYLPYLTRHPRRAI